MPHADRQTRLSVVLADSRGEDALREAIPQLFLAPIPDSVREMLVGTILDYAQVPDEVANRALEQIAAIPVAARAELAPLSPDPAYESDKVGRGSATFTTEAQGEQWVMHEIAIEGPSHGNPFVDVDLWAVFRLGAESVRVGGFYAGEGRWMLRFLPPTAGSWQFSTGSTARSLDGLEGTIEVAPATGPGPVRAEGLRFVRANSTAFTPVGTTLYAWSHQGGERESQTLRTLAETPFTKVRMCVLPKHYDFNNEEPPRFPFERSADGSWDTTRFNIEFFEHFEERIADLATLGIEADVILLHPYDRWGFADMGKAADDRFVRYVVRRLSGFANVWWSLANEYDLMGAKRDEDWARIGELVATEDHAGHPISIHNGTRVFDFAPDWVTHCSIQRPPLTSPVDEIAGWRARWGKPVVIDELGYEGDIAFEWGSLSPQELVRRFWQISIRGAYATHGETYLNDENKLWWATGGRLVGHSAPRIALLKRLIEESPVGYVEPFLQFSHIKAAGVAGRYELHYVDYFQPRWLRGSWPEGRSAAVDIIDVWEMTIDTLDVTVDGDYAIELPGRPNLVVRLRETE